MRTPRVNLDDREVHRRTRLQLLCFVSVVCVGDLEVKMEKDSKMALIEEWIFYFQLFMGTIYCDGKTTQQSLAVRKIASSNQYLAA